MKTKTPIRVAVDVLLIGTACADFVFTPTDDSYVQSGTQANNNYGTSDSLKVKQGAISNGTTRRAYLRFDISGSGPEAFEGAALDLKVADMTQPTTVQIYGINDDTPGQTWDEGSLNWTNAPANTNSNNPPVVQGEATLLATVALTSGSDLSITNLAILDFLNADTDGQVSFIISGGESGPIVTFYSKEDGDGSNSPRLTLIPESYPSFTETLGDAHIRPGSYSENNYGSNASLLVKVGAISNGTTKKTYLTFDIAATEYGYGSFSAASLDLWPTTAAAAVTLDVYGVNDDVEGQDWNENTVTWSNAIANESSNSTPVTPGEGTLIARIEVANGQEEVSISNANLLQFINDDTDGRLTFIIAGVDSGESISFHSKEGGGNALAPTLSLVPVRPIASLIPVPGGSGTQLEIEGARHNTLYWLYVTQQPNFAHPDRQMVPLDSASVGVLDRDGVVTDDHGDAVANCALPYEPGTRFLIHEVDLFTQHGTDPTFKTLLEDGILDPGNQYYEGPVYGSLVDVNNELVEMGIADPTSAKPTHIHTENNSAIPHSQISEWSRWYQEDGNTQVFRLFEGEQNIRGGTGENGSPGRTEAYKKFTVNPGEWLEWEGVYTVIKPLNCAIFQLKFNGDRWAFQLRMGNGGNIYLNHRSSPPNGQPDSITIEEDAIGRNVWVKVRYNGLNYEVYRRNEIGQEELLAWGNYSDSGENTQFRWGMYRSSAAGASIEQNTMLLVTGVKMRSVSAP